LTQLFDGEEITDLVVWKSCARGHLLHSRLGVKLVASKARIREHFYNQKPPTC
jgi:hypothetical protein